MKQHSIRAILKISAYVSLSALVAPLFGVYAYAQTSDQIRPTVPTSFSAAVDATTISSVSMSWTASTDDVGVTGYYIYRNGNQIYATDATSYTDFGLSPGYYTYNVVAYDAAGNVSPWSVPSSITIAQDLISPTAPSNLAITLTSYNPPQIQITWTASTDNVRVAGYKIYRNGNLMWVSSPITESNYIDYNVNLGASYAYEVVAYDGANNYSERSSRVELTIVNDGVAPSIPSGLTAITTSSNAVYLSWRASIDNVGVTGYSLYRNGTKITDLASSTLSYSETVLTDGQYTYSVSAYDFAGNVSGQSYPATANIKLDANPPSIPEDLVAKAVYASRVDLAWRASFDNVGVAGYYVYRDSNQIGTVSSLSYSDTGLSSSTRYIYTVAAYDVQGNVSSPSFMAPVQTLSRDILPIPELTPNTTVTPAPVGTSGATALTTVPSVSASGILTLGLYRGKRDGEVPTLQNMLYSWGYITSDSRTGYFGALTEQAVKKFQCDKAIVCTGDPASTGWGSVGARTRKAMNDLRNNSGGVNSSVTTPSAATQSANAQLQALLLQLQALQLQMQAAKK